MHTVYFYRTGSYIAGPVEGIIRECSRSKNGTYLGGDADEEQPLLVGVCAVVNDLTSGQT